MKARAGRCSTRQSASLFATRRARGSLTLVLRTRPSSAGKPTREPSCQIEATAALGKSRPVAAYCTGCARRSARWPATYAKTREQFGKAMVVPGRQASLRRHGDPRRRGWAQTVCRGPCRPIGPTRITKGFRLHRRRLLCDRQRQEISSCTARSASPMSWTRTVTVKRAHVMDMAFGPIARAKEALLACPESPGGERHEPRLLCDEICLPR